MRAVLGRLAASDLQRQRLVGCVYQKDIVYGLDLPVLGPAKQETNLF
jgi:hypothetical protein